MRREGNQLPRRKAAKAVNLPANPPGPPLISLQAMNPGTPGRNPFRVHQSKTPRIRQMRSVRALLRQVIRVSPRRSVVALLSQQVHRVFRKTMRSVVALLTQAYRISRRIHNQRPAWTFHPWAYRASFQAIQLLPSREP
ncbi:hypothetical protein HOLleu_05958 [Holothuria leucospilota]|uniref:Uncharacterized protein n=1 Tax=Holothuria leucospilota TaxID=206669 RepID=A0A9Q1CM55_HOLLE|nr:hypothetical protein HOLleu_05958 [Holothuria leucospilota]